MDFWARRMRRILPAGVLVLCASLVGAAILLPPALESRAAKELPAAALYFINWRLADKAVDYFADNAEPSLFLQYWSLAIEEQFYAVWPLIVILISIVAVRFFRNTALARVLMWTAIAITLMSFGTCLYLTGHNQPYAFFGTFSRAWQLGIGATIGLLPLVSINVYARRWMALAGIVAIVFAAVLFIAALVLSITENSNGFTLSEIMFETASALGTVGLSTGVTGPLTTLTDAGKLIIIAVMLIGRLGPLTLLAALTFNIKPARYNYPDEAVIVG